MPVKLKADCYNDTLLFLSELQEFINKRHEEMPEGSYTTGLFRKGVNRVARKVGEEALSLPARLIFSAPEDAHVRRDYFFARTSNSRVTGSPMTLSRSPSKRSIISSPCSWMA